MICPTCRRPFFPRRPINRQTEPTEAPPKRPIRRQVAAVHGPTLRAHLLADHDISPNGQSFNRHVMAHQADRFTPGRDHDHA